MTGASSSNWRLLPWLLGLLSVTVYLGGTVPIALAVAGIFLGFAIFFMAGTITSSVERLVPGWLLVAIGAALFLPLVPLPAVLVKFLSPERYRLALAFPLEASQLVSWLPLSISPADTVHRLWEIALLVAVFQVACQVGYRSRGVKLFAVSVLAMLVIESMAQAWLVWGNRETILGIWNNRWMYAGGTFFNRNHFANWMAMALLFSMGWVLRCVAPMRGARSTEHQGIPSRPWQGALVFGLVLFGLAMMADCGSRGGFLSLCFGLMVFLGALAFKSNNPRRLVIVWGGAVCLGLVALVASGLLFQRLVTAVSHLPYKVEIWRQTLAMTGQFPAFGTGWGTFHTIFAKYKEMGGDKTFWHAENDIVQTLSEGGLLGGGLILFLVVRLLWAVAGRLRREKLAEPELAWGAFAALAACLFHCQFEFVLQIPANILLAGALLGLLVGLVERPHAPIVQPVPDRKRWLVNFSFACVLIGLGFAQLYSAYCWHRAPRQGSLKQAINLSRASIQWSPWQTSRHQYLMRAQVFQLGESNREQQQAAARLIRAEFNRTLAWDPFNWQLRLERAWFDLAYAEDRRAAREEIWAPLRLNPMQPEVAFRFVGHFADRDPELALEILRFIRTADRQLLLRRLGTAYEIESAGAVLWSMTPDTVPAVSALGDFAASRGLFPVADQAYSQLSNRMDHVALAQAFLNIQQHNKALALLENQPSGPLRDGLRVLCLYQLGRHTEMLTAFERWYPQLHLADFPPSPPPQRDASVISPVPTNLFENVVVARRFAWEIDQQLTNGLAKYQWQRIQERFSDDLAVNWIAYRHYLDNQEFLQAAIKAARLTEVLLRQSAAGK
jgi:O-antigen ligase